VKEYQEFEINYYQDEDGVFTAVVPAIRGCVASGKTLEDAYRDAIDAIESCMEAREEVAALKLRRAGYMEIRTPRHPMPFAPKTAEEETPQAKLDRCIRRHEDRRG